MRNFYRILFHSYIWICASLLFMVMSVLVFFLIENSISPLLHFSVIEIWDDLFPPIFGTIAVTLFSVLLASPLGLLTGIFIDQYTAGRLRNSLIFIFKVLGGIPSIVVGIFGFIIIVMANSIAGYKLRPCLLISGISLALLILPYIVHSTIIALRSIPLKEKIIGLSLGAKKFQNIFFVLLPKSLPALFSGIILSIGRAAEDTAVIMLTGVAALAGLPSSLLKPYEALPFYIYLRSSEYRSPQELSTVYIASVVIILICISLIFISTKIQKEVVIRIKR